MEDSEEDIEDTPIYVEVPNEKKSSFPPEYKAECDKRVKQQMNRIEQELRKVPTLKHDTDTIGRTKPERTAMKDRKYESIKVVDCAKCGKMLLGESEEQFRIEYMRKCSKSQRVLPPPVAARICERPFCGVCIKTIKVKE